MQYYGCKVQVIGEGGLLVPMHQKDMLLEWYVFEIYFRVFVRLDLANINLCSSYKIKVKLF
jgi:hypothetical protein